MFHRQQDKRLQKRKAKEKRKSHVMTFIQLDVSSLVQYIPSIAVSRRKSISVYLHIQVRYLTPKIPIGISNIYLTHPIPERHIRLSHRI